MSATADIVLKTVLNLLSISSTWAEAITEAVPTATIGVVSPAVNLVPTLAILSPVFFKLDNPFSASLVSAVTLTRKAPKSKAIISPP